MTETRAEYLTRTSNHGKPKSHTCPGCLREFGVEVHSGAMLLIGNVLVQYFSGECGNCGGKLDWSSVDRYMNRITARAKARQR